MNSPALSNISVASSGTASDMLNNVISDLKSKSDIQGAVLLDRNGHVIARALPHEGISKLKLSELLPMLLELSQLTPQRAENIMFPHLFSEDHDCKILARSVKKDLFLLVLLQESCYMGPAMLDMENSVLRIREILTDSMENSSWYTIRK